MKTIGDKLAEHGGFGPGFSFIRIFLAYSVLVWHTTSISNNSAADALETAIWPYIYSILPMFFALSGFLVTGSALRLPLRHYILNRAFRIVPALGVDVFFCALVIGPILTTEYLNNYLLDPLFLSYFGNIFGWVHYFLPGVFLDNPYPGIVNGALWTVPYEIACYVIMSLMIWWGLITRPRWVLGGAIFIMIISITFFIYNIGSGEDFYNKFLRAAFLTKGASLVPSFLAGSALYLLKDKVPHSGWIAILIFLLFSGLGFFGSENLYENPIFISISTLPLAYLVVWLGMVDIPNLSVLEKGDYSYGIYLYHFPILQTLQVISPTDSWWKLSFIGVPIVTLFAIFSWHMIEKPVLKFRRKFSLVGARIAAEDNSKIL